MRRSLVAAMVLVVLAGCGADRRPVGPAGAPPVRFVVAEKATVRSVAEALEKKGIVRSARYFQQVATGTIRPGIYALSPGETAEALYGHLHRGDVAGTKVTFPEGFTIEKIAARLVEKKVLTADGGAAFATLVREKGKTLGADLPADLEGYLFPDTYVFALDATPEAVASELIANFRRRVEQGLHAELEASGKELAQLVTVASLVEREAETDEDRPRIAGVIYNRLAKGMKLQIDATVQYALPQHKARLLFSDLKIDSPYNTYLHTGLPPGPICSPGLASLRAAAAPEKHDYLFYVLGSGKTHLFARTFEEHRANIARVRGKRG